jgi:alkylation response protein AidB-like acyl-CoA dehydrogenase
MDFRLTEEQQQFKDKVRRFARDRVAPIADQVDESEETSWELVKLIGEQDFCTVLAPEEYGGIGVNSLLICLAREEFSQVCLKADGIFVMQGIGSYPITLAGTEEQKQKYLPPIITCQKLCSFCLTEPNAGSDVAGLQATARSKGDHWLLNGDKCYVDNPGDAEIYVVFAKTEPEKGSKGISAFIVEKSFPGISFEKMHLSVRSNIGHLIMTDCRVPRDNLLGEPGRGMRIALSNLDVFRTSVGAAAVGLAQRAFDDALSYAKRRIAFGVPLAEFQAIQFKLADMATQLDAARLLVYRAASMRDQGVEAVIQEASMAKLFATEMGQRVVDEALQIHGGVGLARGMRVEFLYRAIRQPRIYEGTSEIQRITIARQILRG